jgi:hypothetical protein
MLRVSVVRFHLTPCTFARVRKNAVRKIQRIFQPARARHCLRPSWHSTKTDAFLVATEHGSTGTRRLIFEAGEPSHAPSAIREISASGSSSGGRSSVAPRESVNRSVDSWPEIGELKEFNVGLARPARSQKCFVGWSSCWCLGWASSASSSRRSRVPPRVTAVRPDRRHLVTGVARAIARLAISACHVVRHTLDREPLSRSTGLETDVHLRMRRDLPIQLF